MMASESTREFLSRRVRSIKQSPSNYLNQIQIATEMRASGRDIVSFARGEPDFPTPEHIKQAAVEAMRMDFTHYTVVRRHRGAQAGGVPQVQEEGLRRIRRAGERLES